MVETAKWVKIKKEDYNIINSDNSESDSENEHQEDGKENLDQ